MVRTYQLLAHKYSLSADDVGAASARHLQLDAQGAPPVRARAGRLAAPAPRRRRATACSTRRSPSSRSSRPSSSIRAPSVSTENIYQKRHIAAGIPSIYGNYNEAKFDALGLSFRVENLVDRLFDDLVAEGIEPYVTRGFAEPHVGRHRALRAGSGRRGGRLARPGRQPRTCWTPASAATTSRSASTRTCSSSWSTASPSSPRTPSSATTRCCTPCWCSDTRQCEARSLSVDAVAEMVLREVLVSALGMQALDRYAAAALRRISLLNGRLGSQALTRMMNYDPERLVSPIHKPKPGTDDQRTLGFKGLGLKQMASYGHNVPAGLRPQHGAVQRHAGAVVPAPLRRHHPAHPQGPGRSSRRRPACAWATRRARCCCRSARAPPSRCRAS